MKHQLVKRSFLSFFIFACCVACFAVKGPGFKNKITEKPEKPVNLIFEAEEFDNLSVYPDFHREKGQGFYTKEHTHASGRAFIVCDAESLRSSITKKFDETFSAGDYLIGVKTVLTRWRANDHKIYGKPSGNILRVELGMLEDGKFSPVAIIKLRPLYGSGYSFTPLVSKVDTQYIKNRTTGFAREVPVTSFEDPVVKAEGQWNAVRLIAEQIVSGGIGDVPEFPVPYIIIDQVKITNMPGYNWTSHRRGRFNLATAFEVEQKAKEKTKAKAAIVETKPEGVVQNGNLLLDGSFEIGGRPYWNPGMYGNEDFTFDPQDLTKAKCPDGLQFARIKPVQANPYPDNYDKVKSYRGVIKSNYFKMLPGDYKLSFFARANKPEAKIVFNLASGGRWRSSNGKTLVRNSFTITKEWKQYTLDIKSDKAMDCHVLFIVDTIDPKLAVDLDDVKLAAAGAEEKKYKALVGNPALFGVFHDSETLKFETVLDNRTKESKEFEINYKIIDNAGICYEKGTEKIKGGAGITRKELKPDFKGYGNFILVAKIAGEKADPLLIPFSRVQDPARMEKNTKLKSYLGALGRNIREHSGCMLRRYGYEFVATLSDTILRANSNSYGYHKHHVYRNEVEQTRKAGLNWTPWIFPPEAPDYDLHIFSSGPAAGARPWMSPAFGAWYTQFILKNYRGLYENMFMVTDELMNNYIPESALPYVLSVYKAIKEKDPSMRVMNSIEFQPAEAFTRELGGMKGVWTDVMGGSRYNTGKWWYLREAAFLKKYDMPFFIDGVGWAFNSADLQMIDDRGFPLKAAKMFSDVNHQAWDLAAITATYRPIRYSVYTSKYGSGATDPFNQFSIFDGRPTTMATQWIILEQFMREAKAGGLLFAEKASNIDACCFTIKDMIWVTLHAAPPALLKEIELDVPSTDLTILDAHLIPRKPSSKFLIKRGETLFVGSKNNKLLDAVKNMKAVNRLEVRYIIAENGADVDCMAYLNNNTEKTVTGSLTLYKDMLFRKDPVTFNIKLPKGESRTFTVKQNTGIFKGRPVVRYPVYANLSLDNFIVSDDGEVADFLKNTAEGNYMRSGDYFWLHYALPMKFRGRISPETLKEWQIDQTPASVYINWGLNGSYQRSQVRFGAENTDPNMKLDGSMEYDYMSRHYIRYDEKALYIGAVIEEELTVPESDVPADWGETVEYIFQPGLRQNLGKRNPGNTVRVKVIQTGKNRIIAEVLLPDGHKLHATGISQTQKGKRSYIVRVLFDQLGFFLKKGDTLGFDIICRDSDSKNGKLEAEYDWSGASFRRGDSFGFGQLILK